MIEHDATQLTGQEPRLRARALRVSVVKDVIQTIAFTLAGIWAVTTFWYKERWVPEHLDATLTASTTVERLGQRGEDVALKLKLTLHNPGKTRVRVLALNQSVVGFRLGPAAVAPALPVEASIPRGLWQANKVPTFGVPRVLFSRGEVDWQWPAGSRNDTGTNWYWLALEPDASVESEFAFNVSQRDADVIRVETLVVYDPKPTNPDGAEIPAEWLERTTGPNGELRVVPSARCRAPDIRCRLQATTSEVFASLWR